MIRVIANGLWLWSISGFVFVIFGLLLFIGITSGMIMPSSLFMNQIMMGLSAMVARAANLGGQLMIISIVITIVECVLYRKICKKAKQKELPQESWVNIIIGINVYNVVITIISNIFGSLSGFSYQDFISIAIKVGCIVLLYDEYRKWKVFLKDK